MTGRLLLGAASLLAIAGLGWLGRPSAEAPAPRPEADRPPLALLTSLPLIFGEEFSLDAAGSPALARIEQRYRVLPIGVADAASLKDHKLLLMAHPRAQPAEVLVELDQWVRDGGRLLLLADPKLDWPSKRPLGDRLRPPPMFADTGLLAHWGLTLTAPAPDSGVTVGRLERSSSECAIDADGAAARCRIGKGRATVLADADFLNAGEAGDERLDLLVDELARLESR